MNGSDDESGKGVATGGEVLEAAMDGDGNDAGGEQSDIGRMLPSFADEVSIDEGRDSGDGASGERQVRIRRQ